jgi:hypothetical protein
MSARDRLASLLEIARDVLRAEVQPSLDAGQRYTAAMIGSAMAIAGRALAGGADSEARQHAGLAALYPDSANASLAQLERRLARELRHGRLDVEREEHVRAVLLARTLARLEITNPDYPSGFLRTPAGCAGHRPDVAHSPHRQRNPASPKTGN